MAVPFVDLVDRRYTDAWESQVREFEALKSRLTQYSDYDEIKRELEIMKVCIAEFS
jgi:hypothetical protein